MIPHRTLSALQPPLWQQAMRDAITDPHELLRVLDLLSDMPGATFATDFPLRVPRGYVARMRKGDPFDPLLRQVLPRRQENENAAGYQDDAVGDLAASRAGGVLQKYQGRALLIATGACAVHCRYCFRRHFPYEDANAARNGWREALGSIAADQSIEEVILSGGDPLSLTDRKLAVLAAELDAIPHLKRLRVHTRHPIVLPERVDDAFLTWLGSGRLQRVVVVHANHPQEIDGNVAVALRRISERGVTVLNQSVLLHGINNDAGVLAKLSERLFECGVMPYYLHQLDRVRGTAHFEVPDTDAKRLMRELAAMLPGYLVPRLVREMPGEPNKLPLAW